MIRITLLYLFLSGIILYAWKDWYKSLCGLIILMAFIEHPDMPKTLLGIQGLNPWNIGLGFITLAWALNRRREGLSWDMPRHVNLLLLCYLAVVIIGFFRLLRDQGELINFVSIMEGEIPSNADLWSEYLINTIKWAIPGLLLFDGCRSRERFFLALFACLGVYFLLALQVIKWMPLEAALEGDSLSGRSAKILRNEIGYHRVNLSMMLAGASWAIFSTQALAKRWRNKLLIVLASLIVFFAQALTAGRTGYVTWAIVGLVLCLFRWRKYLLIAPVLVLLIISLVPGVLERMSQGFTPESQDVNPLVESSKYYKKVNPGNSHFDLYTITAGRNIAWPYVIEKIVDSPFIGYGREAMERTGLSMFLWNEFEESFPHPHNAYLQSMLDNGLFGSIPIFGFFVIILVYSMKLFRDSREPSFVAVGGMALALVLALLVASIGSQTFYPREGAVGMWCAIGIMLRVYNERSRMFPKAVGASEKALKRDLWESKH